MRVLLVVPLALVAGLVDSSFAADDPSALASEHAVALVRSLVGVTCGHDEVVLDRPIALGEPAVAPLRSAVADEGFAGRPSAAWGLGRLLGALGREADPAAKGALKGAAEGGESRLASMAKAGLAAWERGRARPVADGAPEDLVAEFVDGNEHRETNYLLVDRLLLRSGAALAPVIAAVRREDHPGRGYAAWALGKLLRIRDVRPPEAVAALREAGASSSACARTLAASALRILGIPVRSAGPVATVARKAPNPWLVQALRSAPGIDAGADVLVRSLRAKGGGPWNAVVGDRIVALGEKSLPVLARAVRDPDFPCRAEAAFLLGRVMLATRRAPADVVADLRRLADEADGPLAKSAAFALRPWRQPLPEAEPAWPDSVEDLIGEFRDRPGEASWNNMIVDRVLLQGKAAVEPLTGAIRAGNRIGYVAWALMKLVRTLGVRPEEAMEVLRARGVGFELIAE